MQVSIQVAASSREYDESYPDLTKLIAMDVEEEDGDGQSSDF